MKPIKIVLIGVTKPKKIVLIEVTEPIKTVLIRERAVLVLFTLIKEIIMCWINVEEDHLNYMFPKCKQ